MEMKYTRLTQTALMVIALVLLIGGKSALAQPGANNNSTRAETARIVSHWNSDRRASAQPRDLVIDHRGLGFLRGAKGELVPYGHNVAAEAVTRAKPPGTGGGGGNSDNTPPTITNMDPSTGQVIGASHTFSATVTDESGVKSVTFTVFYPDGINSQSFSANRSGDTWSANLQGFTDGVWSWRVSAKDASGRGGNTGLSATVDFTVDTGGGSGGNPPPDGVITNAEWTNGGLVQTAAGRIYFEMPKNAKRKGPWQGFVCSGTSVENTLTSRSLILTAAHCVYDDANNAFARNVLFIPNQAGTSGSATDQNCDNDPIGCWTPSFGAVDTNWTTSVFPNNVEWDYAFYVVDSTGAHSGAGNIDNLATAAGVLSLSFLAPALDDGNPAAGPDFTHALGYSYSDDPNFMFCAEDMTTEGTVNWWLPSCELSSGSSGGPWIQPMDTGSGSGPVISVNSWGYTTSAGMAGPMFSNSSAACVHSAAGADNAPSGNSDGDAGIIVSCP